MGCFKLTYREELPTLKVVKGFSFSKEKSCAGLYRYGFNGKEKTDEVTGVTGATYDYGFRIYDSRLGRFLSVDPLTQSFPWWTPYQFAGNTPIQALDLDGLEILDYRSKYSAVTYFRPTLDNPSGDYVYYARSGVGAEVRLKTSYQETSEQLRMANISAYWTGNSLGTISEGLNNTYVKPKHNSKIENNPSFGAPIVGDGKRQTPLGSKGDGLYILSKGAYQAFLPNTLKLQDKQQEENAFIDANDALNTYPEAAILGAKYLNSTRGGYFDNKLVEYKLDLINYIVDGRLPWVPDKTYGGTEEQIKYNSIIKAVGDIILDNSGLNLKKSKNDVLYKSIWEGYKNTQK